MAMTEDLKKRKRQSYDEIDPETGKPLEDIPGLEPDTVTESVLTAPLGGGAAAGEGMVARMISKGVPSVARGAEQAAAKTAATAAGEAVGTAAGKVGAGLSTREINAALRGSSPRVQDMVLNQPGMMDRLKQEGLGLLSKLEEQIKEGTKSVARASIGAKLRDQMPSPSSNPAPAPALSYRK